MKVDAAPAASRAGFFLDAWASYRQETGQSLAGWAILALLNFFTQVIFRHEMNPGEFGTLNTALAVIGLMTVPIWAINQSFTHYLTRHHAPDQAARIDSLRASALIATETFGWIWGGLCLVLVFLILPLLDLPRFSLQLFTLMNVLVAVGGVISCAVCERGNRLHLWAALLVGATVARVLAGAGLAAEEPWAESGLAAFLLAGFILLTPALQVRDTDNAARWAACRAMWDRDFLLCLGATFSVLLALFLFANTDRIVAQSWMTTSPGFISLYDFDAYQNAGLIARSLLWGSQPLLWILFVKRSRLERTSVASLLYYWIYLVALLLGVTLLFQIAHPISSLFCGIKRTPFHPLDSTADLTARFVPSLAAAMIPLGLLQGLGIFSLASRRHVECFVLGACSLAYALLLFLFGRQPQLMPSYMFGGGLVSLMIVLFVGVVRWGRKQP
jgi:hypothetical protein